MRDPKKLLLVLTGLVPLIVLATVLVAFLLVRAGFGLFVGVGVPFAVSTVFIIVLSVVLGRAASGSGLSSSDDERPRKRDGV
ncbi:MAG: hypothetical protein ACRDSJ_02810 [Rubrobacteraceae bacterium]